MPQSTLEEQTHHCLTLGNHERVLYVGRLAETREVAVEVAMEYGYQYTPRLHVDLWNDSPET